MCFPPLPNFRAQYVVALSILGLLVVLSRWRKTGYVILGVARRDKYYAADAAVSYLLTRNLSVRGEAMWSKNRSNIELFTYPREIYAVKLRYEFK